MSTCHNFEQQAQMRRLARDFNAHMYTQSMDGNEDLTKIKTDKAK